MHRWVPWVLLIRAAFGFTMEVMRQGSSWRCNSKGSGLPCYCGRGRYQDAGRRQSIISHWPCRILLQCPWGSLCVIAAITQARERQETQEMGFQPGCGEAFSLQFLHSLSVVSLMSGKCFNLNYTAILYYSLVFSEWGSLAFSMIFYFWIFLLLDLEYNTV